MITVLEIWIFRYLLLKVRTMYNVIYRKSFITDQTKKKILAAPPNIELNGSNLYS